MLHISWFVRLTGQYSNRQVEYDTSRADSKELTPRPDHPPHTHTPSSGYTNVQYHHTLTSTAPRCPVTEPRRRRRYHTPRAVPPDNGAFPRRRRVWGLKLDHPPHRERLEPD